MNRSTLETFIQKYFLGGSIDSVTWHSTAEAVSVVGAPSDRQVISFIDTDAITLPSGDYSIYDTTQLKSLLRVLNTNVEIKPEITDDIATAFIISDKPHGGNTSVKFVLSDPSVIPPEADEPDLSPFDMTIHIDDTFIAQFIKATSAIAGVETFTVITKDTPKFVVGYSDMNTTRIDVDVETDGSLDNPLTFSSVYLKEVLMANKDAKEGLIEVSAHGAMKLSFTDEIFRSRYYLLQINQSTF